MAEDETVNDEGMGNERGRAKRAPRAGRKEEDEERGEKNEDKKTDPTSAGSRLVSRRFLTPVHLRRHTRARPLRVPGRGDQG